MKKLRLAFLVQVCLCAGTALAQGGPNTTSLVLNCGAAGQFTVVSPSIPTPASLDINSTTVLIATSAVSVFRNPNTNEVILTETATYGAGHGNATALQGTVITCTSEPALINFPGLGEVSATLIITGFTTPRR